MDNAANVMAALPHQLTIGLCSFFRRQVDAFRFYRASIRATELSLVFNHAQVLRHHLQRVILIAGDHLNPELAFFDASEEPPGGTGQISGVVEVCAAN